MLENAAQCLTVGNLPVEVNVIPNILSQNKGLLNKLLLMANIEKNIGFEITRGVVGFPYTSVQQGLLETACSY